MAKRDKNEKGNLANSPRVSPQVRRAPLPGESPGNTKPPPPPMHLADEQWPANVPDTSPSKDDKDKQGYDSFVLDDLGPQTIMANQSKSAKQYGHAQPRAKKPLVEPTSLDLSPPVPDDLPPQMNPPATPKNALVPSPYGPFNEKTQASAFAPAFSPRGMQPIETSFTQAVMLEPGQQVELETREITAELKDPRLVLVHDPDSPQAASYRVLGHRLTSSGAARTIVVTSANDGDGKTTCATNLAMALSECGRARVLLVEANLRKPAVSRMLGFSPPVCFADQLTSHRNDPESPWTIVHIPSAWIHVAAVDAKRFSKPRVIDGPSLELGIQRLKYAGFEYIILDTPSTLGCADVTLIQDCVDGILLASWARKSKGSALRKAINLLAPSKILGIAMLEV